MGSLNIIDWTTDVWKLLIRLLAAGVCGFAIGFERKTRSKEAGIRTHTIVSIASCLMMILSKYAFTDIGDTDGARIAAQVVTGIGFLGAGMIFYRRDMLHGLTTAAGIWATAAIGMSFGAGMFVTAVCCTLLLIGVQLLLHLPFKFLRGRTFYMLKCQLVLEDETVIPKIKELLNIKKILKFTTTANDNIICADMEFVTDRLYSADELYKLTRDNNFIKSLEKTDEI